MQRLEVSCAVRRIYRSLGFKGLINVFTVLLYFQKLPSCQIFKEVIIPHIPHIQRVLIL